MSHAMTSRITLRDMVEADISICFEHQLDPEAGRMAAFTSKDGKDKAAYLARWTKLLRDRSVNAKMIILDGKIVGTIADWGPIEERQVTYWIWREHWGKGVASAALSSFLELVKTRPLFGSVAHDNRGSIRVLEKCGFTQVRKERFFANARGEELDEVVLKLG